MSTTMVSSSSDRKTKIIRGIENLDRISQLPEPIILRILSCLPLEDSARASVLSKTWTNYCSLYPILSFDFNLFALRSLLNNGDNLNLNQIRDTFMNEVDFFLSRAVQLDFPIRKLALNMAVNDPYYCFPRVDAWLELLKQSSNNNVVVEEFCFCIQSPVTDWEISVDHDRLYNFPIPVLASIKGLRSAYIRGCNLFVDDTTFIDEDPINKNGLVTFFSSLQRLYLSHVYMGAGVFEYLATYCKGIEVLVLNDGDIQMEDMELGRFPKLKKVVIEPVRHGWIDYIDIANTKLECLKFCIGFNLEFRISPAACAAIRELSLQGRCTFVQPSLFADLTATFPLLEVAKIRIHDTETFKAAGNILTKLTLYKLNNSVPVKDIHVDCPSLTFFDCIDYGLVQLYFDCPKVGFFRYYGTTIPKRYFFGPMPDLYDCRVEFYVNYAYDTLWFVHLREFLVPLMASPTYLYLTFTLPMTKFEPEKVEAIKASPRYNVHLKISIIPQVEQNVPIMELAALMEQNAAAFLEQSAAALTDALLWIIRPTTFIVGCVFQHMMKYLCENLMKKSGDDNVPCWRHELEDFEIESSLDIPDMKENLATLPEQCSPFRTSVLSFTFRWSN